MKRYAKFSILLVFLCAAAFASLSGNYLCVQRSGVTYKHKLYTSTADVGSPRMGVRVGGATRYAKLLPTSSADGGYMRVRHSGTTYKVAQNAHAYALKWGSQGTGAGQFQAHQNIAIDSSSNVYVVDRFVDRIQKFSASGTLLSWTGIISDLGAAYAVAVDSSGYVYAGCGNAVWRFDASGANRTLVFTAPGAIDDLAISSSGNRYILSENTVRKYSSAFALLATWGGTGTTDGKFGAEPYGTASGIAIDSSENVYVADRSNLRIQKFNSSGTFLAKWGGTWGDTDGLFKIPYDVATDSLGNVYVADEYNNRVQKFSSSGTFLAKWGSSGAADGQFNHPQAIAVSSSDNVYVGDTYNYRVQRFD